MRYKSYLKYIFRKKEVNWMNESFSQEGEDVILKGYIEENNVNSDGAGIYVDLGAHHPYRFSNTSVLYSIGWRGINVDANPDSIRLFKVYRKKDINLNVGVSDIDGVMDYYSFDDSALNTFDSDLIEVYKKKGYRLMDTQKVKVMNINDLLEQYIPKGKRIDLLDIDVEGFDDAIINSLDWKKYSPSIVLAERDMSKDDYNITSNDVLQKHGYRIFAATNRTVIYVK